MKLIVEAMNDASHRAMEIWATNARTKHLIMMNVSKLSEEQLRTLERSIEDYRELAENYRFKNLFSDIYRHTTRNRHRRSWTSDAMISRRSTPRR